MKSAAADVKAYVEEQPEEWHDSLEKLRAACRKQLRGYSEGMTHGMPSYIRAGRVEVAFAKQARYLSLYVLNERVLDAQRASLIGLAVGKGCIRYRTPRQIDWTVVAELLSATAVSNAEIC